jgi:hypothetical protein
VVVSSSNEGPPCRLEVSIDGKASAPVPIAAEDSLDAVLAPVAGAEYAEVVLTMASGASLMGLFHGGWGWLEWFPGDDSRTLHTENPEHPEPEGTRWDFVLSNGQTDEYPASWTYDFETVKDAFRYALETGERDPGLEWFPDW